jgi:hypothetical protein
MIAMIRVLGRIVGTSIAMTSVTASNPNLLLID